MSRPPSAFTAVHAAADHYEAVLRARFVRAATALRASVSINDLAMRLSHPKQALALLPKTRIREALAPVATTAQEAFMKGGQLGAAQLNQMRGAT
jgi:hypothetical protein